MIFDTFCILTMLVAVIGGASVPYEISSHGHRLVYLVPVQLGLIDSENTISTYARLMDIETGEIASCSSPLDETNIQSDRLIIGDEDNRIVVPVNMEIPNIDSPEILLSMQPGSPFIRAVGSILIIPENSTHGQIIVNRRSPRSYVYERQMQYTRLLDSRNDWMIEARFSVFGEPTEPQQMSLLPFMDVSLIPIEALNEIQSELSARGTIHSNEEVTLNTGTDINDLPTLFLHVQNTDGFTFSLGILPTDYLVPVPDQPNQYRLTIGPHRGLGAGILGRNLLDKIVLDLDRVHGLVGFGDPLTEM